MRTDVQWVLVFRSLIPIFDANIEYTFARCEKY